MFRLKVKRLIDDYGIKREYIIKLINSNRVSFKKKLETEGFTDIEMVAIKNKYGTLLN